MKSLFSIVATVAFWAVGGAVVAVLVHLLSPLTQSEFNISIVGFGLFGLFVGLSEVGPVAFRRFIAREFAHRLRPTMRETVLWGLVVVVVLGVFIFDRYRNAL
jgi:hypothetical protein